MFGEHSVLSVPTLTTAAAAAGKDDQPKDESTNGHVLGISFLPVVYILIANTRVSVVSKFPVYKSGQFGHTRTNLCLRVE